MPNNRKGESAISEYMGQLEVAKTCWAVEDVIAYAGYNWSVLPKDNFERLVMLASMLKKSEKYCPQYKK